MKQGYTHHTSSVRHRAARRHLVKAAIETSDGCLGAVRSINDWSRLRPEIAGQFSWMLGHRAMGERRPAVVRCAGVVQRESYRIEKILLETGPRLFVTANFYVPTGLTEPAPCILYLNGHWPSLHGAKSGFQDRYLWYPAHGFALLVVDPIQFGEVPGVHLGTNRLGLWHWASLGYTPAAVEVWNAMCAIDWLETRDEVDTSRLGVTGVSGGGVMTQFLAAVDERVSVAAASCSTYTIGDQARRGLVPEQCDCTYFPNVYRLDLPAVLALIAPRPLMILGGRRDPIFPPSGFRRAFEKTERIYGLYHEVQRGEQRIRLVESGDGHADPPRFLEETRRWLVKWLGAGDSVPREECARDASTPESPGRLGCLESVPRHALNQSVHDCWFPRPSSEPPQSATAWQARRHDLLEILSHRIFEWVPMDPPPFDAKRLRDSGGFAGQMAHYSAHEISTEGAVRVRVQVLRPRESRPSRLVVWVRGPGDQARFPDLDELLPLLRSSMVLMVSPRFAERPLNAAERALVERTSMLTGRSIATQQTWDVLRAVSWATPETGNCSGLPVTVYAKGDACVPALYAGVLEPRLTQIILRDPPASHWQGPPVPTILRDADLPEIAALLAPRLLGFVREMPSAYCWTRRVFDIVGANDKCVAFPSLADACIESESEHGR